MKKKSTLKELFLIVFTCLIMPFIAISKVNAEEVNYEVAMVNSDGTVTSVSKHQLYWPAYYAMVAQESTPNSVAVIYRLSDNKIINAENAIAKVNATDALTLNLYKNSNNSVLLTSIATDYGTDAVLVNYENAYGTVQIKISGAMGWVDITDVDLIPVSLLNKARTSLLITGDMSINMRAEPNTSAKILDYVSKGQTYASLGKTTGEGFTWYKITKGGQTGWIASAGTHWVKETTTTENLNTYYYINANNDLVHTYETDNDGQVYLTINPNPGNLKQNTKYYSFDGNYFYTDLFKLTTDAKSGKKDNSINASNPFYAYYVYLPSHSKTGYSAGNFDNIIAINHTAKTSKMYGMGYAFVEMQNTYGVNALQAFSKAVSESNYGTSKIAMDKNNLFGMGAVDNNPYNGATKYNSPYDSIMDYGKVIGYSAYNNPWAFQYHGGNYGNKASGLNVRYATDQYWGEKQAATSYSYDKNFGGMDVNSYTLGIKRGHSVIKVYKKPEANSAAIYETKNYHYTSTYGSNYTIENLAFIVTDKVNGYYKVYTDPTLDKNQNVNMNLYYTFDNSYGWIKESDLYVTNTQPVITVSDIEIDEGNEVDLKTYAIASDKEDGKVTNITVKGEVDFENAGEYKVTFIATDKQNFSVTKDVIVKVNPSTAPEIQVEDIEVTQYTKFDYLKGVTVIDNDTDIMDKLTYTGTVDTSKVGTYTITYNVTDKDGFKDSKTRTVTVIKDQEPTITAVNKTISVGDTYNYKNGVSAKDKEDGDLTSKITYEETVDNTKPGVYTVTYKVTDSVGNTTTKAIQVTVEEIKYTDKQGVFYLNGMTYNETTKKLNFSGFLTIKGINNVKTSNTKFDLILINQNTKEETIISLDRWLDKVPFTAPSDKGYDYSASWFTSNIDLSTIKAGDYSMYVRSRINTFQTKMEVTNSFFSKNVTNKISLNNRGYLIQTNYTSRTMGIELFVRDYNLLASEAKPTIDNMYNQVYSIAFNNNILNIVGTSHNVEGNYSKKQNVERYIYIENIDTNKIVKEYNVGSITNGAYTVSLRVPDGYDKTKAWYNAKLDISDLEKGKYVIYVRTKTGKVNDYGELSDSLYLPMNATTVVNNKTYKITRNDKLRYRIELIVE